jgi:hypothetical protein
VSRLGLALVLAAGVLAAASTPAHAEEPCTDATPNLEARVVSAVRTIKRPFDHRRRARVAVRIENDGGCSAQGRLSLKPLIAPSNETILHGEHAHPSGDGAVMPSRWIDADIPAGAARTYIIDERLPLLAYQAYRLAIMVDAGHAIAESNELDNTTRMVHAGFLSVERRTSAEDGIDLYTEMRSTLVKQGGGVAHTLGLVARPYPKISIPSHDVFARFLLANMTTNEVYTLVYAHTMPCTPDCPDGYTCDQAMCVDAEGQSAPVIDKEYYALAWGSQEDELGRPVGVDIYWQAPHFVDEAGVPTVPPGDYRFLTVTDTHDLITEFDEGNNLDALPFTLAPFEIVGTPNTWFISTPLGEAPAPVTVQVKNSYAADLAYTVTVPDDAGWLEVTPTSGSLDIDQTDALTFAVERGALTPGQYTADVTISAAGFEAYPLTIAVSFYVYGADNPEIAVAPTSLAFSTTVGVHPPLQTFNIANTGDPGIDLDWEAWPDVEWISIAPPSGSGPAGYDEDVAIVVHPEGIQPGGPYIGHAYIFSNAPDGARTIEVSLVVGPCQNEWDCQQGWTCNFGTGFCEPPTACDTSDECPVGSYCLGAGSYCEPSGICGDDFDCGGAGSGSEAMECNVARTTCEPATCTADDECPLGSYCNEPAAVCPFSGTCSSDFDCFGWPFTFVCDPDRETCEPSSCTIDEECAVGSYCSEFWEACIESSVCTTDLECFQAGQVCDEARGTCEPG